MIACTRCQAPLPPEALSTPDLAPCPTCGSKIRADVFPALLRDPGPARPGETLVVDGDASCFLHPRKKAEGICDQCGRFVCALCEMEIAGQRLCPACVERGEGRGKLEVLSNYRVLHDNIALALAIYPLVIFFVTCITAPAAIYVAVRHWNSASSVIPRTKVRHVLAIAIAALQIAGWGVVLHRLLA